MVLASALVSGQFPDYFSPISFVYKIPHKYYHYLFFEIMGVKGERVHGAKVHGGTHRKYPDYTGVSRERLSRVLSHSHRSLRAVELR
jgi:hypothetical protein